MPADFNGSPWTSMDFDHGLTWIFMQFNGFSWILMDYNQCFPTDFRKVLYKFSIDFQWMFHWVFDTSKVGMRAMMATMLSSSVWYIYGGMPYRDVRWPQSPDKPKGGRTTRLNTFRLACATAFETDESWLLSTTETVVVFRALSTASS